ncbi:MAG TPA: RNA polymerase sigma-70 factor [Balneolaceae bacterium]|nr:RNA polymerase sigma-70 factor [Balneolaceae bacterium]
MGYLREKEIKELALAIKASDENAFSELFHRTYPRLVKFAWRYTQTETTAKDIVQESFVKLWRKRNHIDPAQSMMAYLFQIVRNRSLNHIRDHSPEDDITIDDLPGGVLKSDEYVPEVTSSQNKIGKKMLDWIDHLPGRQREALRLSRFEGLDHEEIAYVMEISPHTVNNHIVSALATLRKNWNDYKNNPNNGT